MKKLLKYLKGYTMESISGALVQKCLEATFELFRAACHGSCHRYRHRRQEPGIHPQNGPHPGGACACRPCLFHYGAVFLRQGGRRLFCRDTACPFSNMYRNFHSQKWTTAGTSTLITRMTSDRQSGAERGEHDPCAFSFGRLISSLAPWSWPSPSTQSPRWSLPLRFRSCPSSFSAS